jgi:hypothetical protein
MAIIIDLTLYNKHNTNKLNVSFYTEPNPNQTEDNKKNVADMTHHHGFSTPYELLFTVPSKTCCYKPIRYVGAIWQMA